MTYQSKLAEYGGSVPTRQTDEELMGDGSVEALEWEQRKLEAAAQAGQLAVADEEQAE